MGTGVGRVNVRSGSLLAVADGATDSVTAGEGSGDSGDERIGDGVTMAGGMDREGEGAGLALQLEMKIPSDRTATTAAPMTSPIPT